MLGVRARSKELAQLRAGEALADGRLTPWLTVDRAGLEARVVELPDETSVPFELRVQLVVEYYAKRL